MSEQAFSMKPCPFCGAVLPLARGYFTHPKVECYLSGLKVSAHSQRDIAAWNRRHAEAEITMLRELLSEREADKARLDSGCIMTRDWNEFDVEYTNCERRGLDLRAAIDAAMAKDRT